MRGVACVAVVGKHNNPVFIQTFHQDDELKFHFIVHTSLDVVDEKLIARDKQGTMDSFLGLLYPTEDYNVYGYVTSTANKLILVMDDTGVEATKIRNFFREFHFLYCDALCNPFYQLGTPIASTKFKERLVQLLANVSAK